MLEKKPLDIYAFCHAMRLDVMVLLWIHKLPAVEEFILHLVLPHVRESEVRGPPWNVIPRLLLAGEGGGEEEERGGGQKGAGGGGEEERRKGRGKKEGKGGGVLGSMVEPWKTQVSFSGSTPSTVGLGIGAEDEVSCVMEYKNKNLNAPERKVVEEQNVCRMVVTP